MALPEFAGPVEFRANGRGDVLVYVDGKVFGTLTGFNDELFVRMDSRALAKKRNATVVLDA